MKAKVEILQKDEAKVYKWGVYNAVPQDRYEWDRYPCNVVNKSLWQFTKMREVTNDGLGNFGFVKVDYNTIGDQQLCYLQFDKCKPYAVTYHLFGFREPSEDLPDNMSGWFDIYYAQVPYDVFIQRVRYDDNLETVLSREWLEENASSLLDWNDDYLDYQLSIIFMYNESVAIPLDSRNILKTMVVNKNNYQKILNSWTPIEFVGQAPSGPASFYQRFKVEFTVNDINNLNAEIREHAEAEISNHRAEDVVEKFKGLITYGYTEDDAAKWVKRNDNEFKYTIIGAAHNMVVGYGYTTGAVNWEYDVAEFTVNNNICIGYIYPSFPIKYISCDSYITPRSTNEYASITSPTLRAAKNYTKVWSDNIDYFTRYENAINILDFEYVRESDGNYGPVYGKLTQGIKDIYFTTETPNTVPNDYVGNYSNSRYIEYIPPGTLVPILADYNDRIKETGTRKPNIHSPETSVYWSYVDQWWGNRYLYDFGYYFGMNYHPIVRECGESYKQKNNYPALNLEPREETTTNNLMYADGQISYLYEDNEMVPFLVKFVRIIDSWGEITGEPERVYSFFRSTYPVSEEGEVFNGYLYKYVGFTSSYSRDSRRLFERTDTNPARWPWNGSIYDVSNGQRFWFVFEGVKRNVLKTYYSDVLLDCSFQQSIGSSNSFSIGAVGGATAQFEILKPIPEIIQYKGYDCYVYFYYPNKYHNTVQVTKEGLLTIRDIEENGFNRTIVTAYDNCYRLDCRAWPLLEKLSPDTDLIRLFYYICAYCDITYATEFFWTNNTLTLGDISEWDKEITCRDVMNWIAQIGGVVMVCDENGTLVVKELDKPILTRGSGDSENYSLVSSMIPVIKPEAIKYKMGNSTTIVGNEYTQWENRILDYTSNGLLSNKNTVVADEAVNKVIKKIQQIEDIYSFECDVDNNLYNCVCGDSWIIEGSNIEPRRGIITDRSVNMSGVHITSSSGIESEYIPQAVDDIDELINTLNTSIFRTIHIENIEFIDSTTNEVYKTIVANYDFALNNSSYSYEDDDGMMQTIDIGSCFDDLFVNPLAHTTIYIGLRKCEVWIENHNLMIIDSGHISSMFTNISDIEVTYCISCLMPDSSAILADAPYSPYYTYPALFTTYKFSEIYNNWDTWKDTIYSEKVIPITFQSPLVKTVNGNDLVTNSILLGGFTLSEVLQYIYLNGKKYNNGIYKSGIGVSGYLNRTEDGAFIYRISNELTFTPGNLNSNAYRIWFLIETNDNDETVLRIRYLPYIYSGYVKPNDDGYDYLLDGRSSIWKNWPTYDGLGPQGTPVVIKANGVYSLAYFSNNFYYDARPSGRKWYHEPSFEGRCCYGSYGADIDIIPLYNSNNNYMGSFCYHNKVSYVDPMDTGWTFVGENTNSDSYIIGLSNCEIHTVFTDYNYTTDEYDQYWYEEVKSSEYYKANQWFLNNKPSGLSEDVNMLSMVIIYDGFENVPTIKSIEFTSYSNWGIDTTNEKIGIFYNTEYFVPGDDFSLIPSLDHTMTLYLYYAPTKQLIGKFMPYVDNNCEVTNAGVLKIYGSYATLDEVVGVA